MYSAHFPLWYLFIYFLIPYRLGGNLLFEFSGFGAEHSCQSSLESTAHFQHIQDDLKVVSY